MRLAYDVAQRDVFSRDSHKEVALNLVDRLATEPEVHGLAPKRRECGKREGKFLSRLASRGLFERLVAFEPAPGRCPPRAPIIFVLEEQDDCCQDQ